MRGLVLVSPPRVLVVDDNVANRELVAEVLSREGVTVDSTNDGRTAIEMFGATKYDCILMDCRMPGMDGFEAAREIRRRWGDTRPVPIIAITAHAMPGDREICLQAGMNDHLAKPYRLASLIEAVDRWLPPPPASEACPPSMDATTRP